MTSIKRLTTGAAMRFVPAPGAEPHERRSTILIVHGWKSPVFTSSSYTTLVEELGTLGYHTLAVSLRGHEESDGDLNRVTREDHLADIEAAIEYMVSRDDVDTTNLGAVAVSYGAYLFAIAQARSSHTFKAIAFRAPALYPDSDWREPIAAMADSDMYSWREQFDPIVGQTAALNALRSFSGQMQIVASENDECIPGSIIQAFAHAAKHRGTSSILTIEDAEHALTSEQRDVFLARLKVWFPTVL